MAKNAVYRINAFVSIPDDIILKRMALGFDTIFLEAPLKGYTKEVLFRHMSHGDIIEGYRQYRALLVFLFEHKVISGVEPSDVYENQKLSEVEQDLLDRMISGMTQSYMVREKIEETRNVAEFDTLCASADGLLDSAGDSLTRFRAISLAKLVPGEFYPILRTDRSFSGQGTKTTVVRLVVDRLPQPDVDTPWEAIVDFRSDEATRLQYLALINWINEMAKSSLTANEINEKLEYLLMEYKRSIERHRLKWKTGILEIVAAATAGFFTGNLPAAINLLSNIVKVGSTALNLQEEEGKLPGKEIAYIYHANQNF
jgi:hypothetical protein